MRAPGRPATISALVPTAGASRLRSGGNAHHGLQSARARRLWREPV
jgi:hypothetical protein